MAEINKLSVNKVFDKLRSNDAKNSSEAELREDKMQAMEEELKRLRTQRNRLKRDPGAKGQ